MDGEACEKVDVMDLLASATQRVYGTGFSRLQLAVERDGESACAIRALKRNDVAIDTADDAVQLHLLSHVSIWLKVGQPNQDSLSDKLFVTRHSR